MHEDKNILLVEDERTLRKNWTKALKEYGFASVAGYERAEDAIEEATARAGTTGSFHLAIIDLKLTTSRQEYRKDPWRLSNELKAANPDLLLIAVSKYLKKKKHQLHGRRKVKVNDYIIKSEESVLSDMFVERVLTVLMTRFGEASPIFRFSGFTNPSSVFTFNCRTRKLTGPNGTDITLGPPAKWLLEHFLRNPMVFLHSHKFPDPALVPMDPPRGLVEAKVKQADVSEEDTKKLINRTIREAIWHIRSGLGDDDIVRTEWGKGYSFNGKVERTSEEA